MMPERPRALLEAADADPQAARLTRLRQLMAYVRDTTRPHTSRAVVSSRSSRTRCSRDAPSSRGRSRHRKRPMLPRASAIWVSRLARALAERIAPAPRTPRRSARLVLIDHDLVTAFEVGWSVLHQEVSLFVAEQLISTLTESALRRSRHPARAHALRRTLVKQRDAGTPWLARDAADILAMLDMTAWISVLGLLDECPVLPAALTAVLEGRTTTVSPTAFDFISTAAQIGDVRSLHAEAPDVLSR